MCEASQGFKKLEANARGDTRRGPDMPKRWAHSNAKGGILSLANGVRELTRNCSPVVFTKAKDNEALYRIVVNYHPNL